MGNLIEHLRFVRPLVLLGMKIFFLKWVLNFYRAQCSVCNFVPFAQWIDGHVETRHVDTNPG